MPDTQSLTAVIATLPADCIDAVSVASNDMRHRLLPLRSDPAVQHAIRTIASAATPVLNGLDPATATATVAFAAGVLASQAFDAICASSADTGPDPIAFRATIVCLLIDALEVLIPTHSTTHGKGDPCTL